MPSNSDLNRLAELAKSAGDNPKWSAYAAFADFRSRGLRAEAFRSLERFIEAASNWSFEERSTFVRWLLGKALPSVTASIVLPQPLSARVAVPTVREWIGREPDSAEACLWLGLLRCDDPSEHLARALALDPLCDRARWTLVEWMTGDVEYNQHHLPDFYIHDPRRDLVALDRIDALIDSGSGAENAKHLKQEVAELRRHAERWLAIHPREGDFAQH